MQLDKIGLVLYNLTVDDCVAFIIKADQYKCLCCNSSVITDMGIPFYFPHSLSMEEFKEKFKKNLCLNYSWL